MPAKVRLKVPFRVVVEPRLPPDSVTAREHRSAVTLAAEQRERTRLERTRSAYYRSLEQYKASLAGRAAPYLTLNHDGVKELVVLDETLWQQLCDMYLYHGWDRIAALTRAITPLISSALPADSLWKLAYRFFEQTRVLLGGLVRAALSEIESLAAARMLGNVRASRTAVTTAWDQYGISRTERLASVRMRDSVTTQFEERYTFSDEAQAAGLMTSLAAAVSARASFESEIQRIADLRNAVARLRAITSRAQSRGQPLSSDRRLTAELDQRSEQAEAAEHAAGMLHKRMLTVADEQSPLGLLVLESLQPGFSREEVEQSLGAQLWRLQGTLDTLRGQIKPDRSLVRKLLPGRVIDEGRADAEPQLAAIPVQGPERAFLEAALQHGAKDGGWLPLLHEATLHQLAEVGDIAPGSWIEAVWGRHLILVARVMTERARDDKASTERWQTFAKVLAAASLTLLAVPKAGPGAYAHAAVGLANLVLLAHSVASVTDQLRRLDELRTTQIVGPDAFSITGLALLGELGVYRERILGGIRQQVLIELALVAAGQQWPVVKQALIARSYLQDLEVLLADDGS